MASSKVNIRAEAAIKALLFDQPVAYHPLIARVVGSVTAGVLLSQLLYWTPRTDHPDGWFYKTRDEFYQETALTRSEQETARKRLKKLGILREESRGLPAKLYFRVDVDQLTALIAADKEAIEPPARWRQSYPQGGGDPATSTVETSPPITETTAESTPESTNRDSSSNHSKTSKMAQVKNWGEERPIRTGQLISLGDLLTQHQTAQNAPGGAFRNSDVHLSSKDQPIPSTGVFEPQATVPADVPAVSQREVATPQLDAAIEEASRKLGDWYHRKSNKTQARNLWRDSGLAEPQLVQLCYEEMANVADRDQSRVMPQVQNRMGYFFECLRQRLADVAARRTSETDEREQADGATEQWAPLPADIDAAVLWDTVLGALKEQVTRPIFETFLRGTAATRRADGALLIATPTPFAQEGLATKLRPLVLQTVSAIAGAAIAVDFVTTENVPGP